MTIVWILAGVVAVGLAGWALLAGVTRMGGQRSGDAASNAGAVVDQANALFSDSSDEPWDGVDRLKVPPPNPGL